MSLDFWGLQNRKGVLLFERGLYGWQRAKKGEYTFFEEPAVTLWWT